MAVWLRPEVLAAYASMWGANALVLLLVYFDMLFSFAIAFALAYGLFSCTEKLLPSRLGLRPRVWLVPVLFSVVVLLSPLFLDRFIARGIQIATGSTIMALMDWFPWFPGDAISRWIVDIAKAAACLWVVGVTVMAFRTLHSFVLITRTVKRLPDAPDIPAVQAAFAATGMDKSMGVKVGPPGSPIVSCGLFRRRIIIPEHFTERYSPKEQYAILVHECVHSKNHDAFKLLCLSIVKTILWFDPVMRHAVKRMKTEMELLCDWTTVYTFRIPPADYASLIVKAMSARPQSAVAFSDTYRLIARRLGHILCDPAMQPPERVSRRGAFFLATGLASLLVAAAILYAGILPAEPLSPAGQSLEENAEPGRHIKREGIFGTYGFMQSSKKRP